MKDKLTQKQENFCLNVFQGMSQREAYIQSYKPNYAITTIDANASRLASNEKVLKRLSELREKAQNTKIASVTERKEILSEIARAKLTDYQESGMDGGWINIGKESPNTASISEIVSTTKYDDNGANPTLITRVRLHNPIEAIKELNKMDGVYSDNTTVVNNDNRQIVVNVVSENARQLTERIIKGE
ncbi:MAG: terminase small subunit [Dehalococcoidales bacterium]|nr:terminase small subunit [Dehalococcoidales bacterium]